MTVRVGLFNETHYDEGHDTMDGDTGGGSLVYFEHLRASVRAKGSVMLVGCSCCGELRQSAVNGCRMQLKELDGKLGEARIHAHTGTQTFMF